MANGLLVPMTRVTYTKERIRFLLSEYQRLAQNARLPVREEVLGTTPGRRQEAQGLATARMKADIEQALQLVPFTNAQITFQVLAIGNTDWRQGLSGWQRIIGRTKKHAETSWYAVVGEWWGIEAGEVHHAVAATIDALYKELNGI